MTRLVHFEIHASDPEQLIAFYSKAFGWRFEKYPIPGMDYWGVYTGDKSQPGIDGGLMRRRGPQPAEGAPVNSFVCTLKADRLDESVRAVTAAGGRQVVPKAAVPGAGWVAYCKDPDGNLFGLWQDDPGAK